MTQATRANSHPDNRLEPGCPYSLWQSSLQARQLSPFCFSHEARSYALFLLLATRSSGFFVEWLQKPSRRNRWGYILASALAAYAHLYALLVVAAHWLSVRGEPEQHPEARMTVPSNMRRAWIGIGLAVLPLLTFVGKTGAGPIRWIARPGYHDVFAFWEYLAGNNGWALLLLYLA